MLARRRARHAAPTFRPWRAAVSSCARSRGFAARRGLAFLRAFARERDAVGGQAVEMPRGPSRLLGLGPARGEITALVQAHQQRVERAGLEAGVLGDVIAMTPLEWL